MGLADAPLELLYHDATILVGLVYTSLLFMVVPLIGTLDTLDDALVEAACDVGGSGPDILRRIVIPHAAPGTTAGCIVAFMLTLGNYLTPTLLELDWLRPGLPLVVLGRFSYIVSTLTIAARLKRFDTTLEEAAWNLDASRGAVLRTITLPYLKPALVGAAAISFLMWFEKLQHCDERVPDAGIDRAGDAAHATRIRQPWSDDES